ncbi:MAG: DUF4886 domain-containing protein [Chthoniobacteraceae bacterium]
MLRFTSIAVAVGLSLLAIAGAETKVLFIGNSFTMGGTASVPVIFDRLAQASGIEDPTIVMRGVGGTDFQFHNSDATSISTINSQLWDYVVLQNYSIEPTHFVDGSHSIADHFQYGEALYDRIMANNPQTKIVLYETWSRAASHSYITGVSGPQSFASTAEMQKELRDNYAALAVKLNLEHPNNPPVQIAPAGSAWENAGGLLRSTDPGFVDLFGGDNYHGDDDGYYLSAATIFSTIYGVSPEGLWSKGPVANLNLQRNVAPLHLEKTAWTTAQSVPEPTGVAMLAAGTVLLAGRRRRH